MTEIEPVTLSGPFMMEATPNELMESEPQGWDVNIGEGVGSSHGILEKAQGVQRSAHSVGFSG